MRKDGSLNFKKDEIKAVLERNDPRLLEHEDYFSSHHGLDGPETESDFEASDEEISDRGNVIPPNTSASVADIAQQLPINSKVNPPITTNTSSDILSVTPFSAMFDKEASSRNIFPSIITAPTPLPSLVTVGAAASTLIIESNAPTTTSPFGALQSMFTSASKPAEFLGFGRTTNTSSVPQGLTSEGSLLFSSEPFTKPVFGSSSLFSSVSSTASDPPIEQPYTRSLAEVIQFFARRYLLIIFPPRKGTLCSAMRAKWRISSELITKKRWHLEYLRALL